MTHITQARCIVMQINYESTQMYVLLLLSGADVRKVHQEAGVPFSLADIEAGLKEHKPLMFFMTHGESSTGVCQPMEGLGDLCKR